MSSEGLLSNVTLIGLTGTLDRTGGAERAFRLVTEGIRDRLGARVRLVAHVEPEMPMDGAAYQVLRPAGEPAGIAMVRRMRRILLEAPRPAILFAFQMNPNIVASIANQSLPPSKRLPVILNDRASIDFMTQARLRRDWKTMLRYRAVAAAARFSYRRADFVVCNAKANAQKTREFIGRDRPPVRTVYNPLPAEEIQARFPARDRTRLQGERPLIAGHGRLDPQKGWDILIRAFARLREQIPGAELLIVGDGPERETLEALVRELGVEDGVRLPGFSTDPLAEIEACDVYVLASRYEGLPNSLLEAIALGLPSIASDCPTGPSEILGTREEHGVLVPVEGVQELSRQLLVLLGDGELRGRLASSARRRALDFTPQANTAGYEEIFRELIDRGRVRG